MKPSKITAHCSAAVVSSAIRGGDQSPSSSSLYQESMGIRRGGAQQHGDYEPADHDDGDGYYYAEDGYEDGDGEYEYYQEGGGTNEDDDYYYSDDEDGLIYLPDADDNDEDMVVIAASKKHKIFSRATRSFRPIKSGATKSLSKINGATTLPVLNLSKNVLAKVSVPLSSLSSNLGKFLPNTIGNGSLANISTQLQELNGPSLAILSVAVLAVAVRSIIILSSSNNSGKYNKNGRKKKKRRKGSNKKGQRNNSMKWKTFWKGGKEEANEDKKKDIESYNDYSEGYPGAEDDDEETMDLDLEDDVKKSSMKKSQTSNWGLPTPKSLTRILDAPKIASDAFHNVWIWICASFSPLKLGLGNDALSVASDATEPGELVDDVVPSISLTSLESSSAATEAAIVRAEQLQSQLDTLMESQDSLEQEYEASLRMLHEARIELRELQQSKETLDGANDNGTDEDFNLQQQKKQKQQMEVMVKKLEIKYKSQMKDQIERIRNSMENKLRSDMEDEVTERLRVQIQSELKDEQTKMEEELEQEMEQRLAAAKQDTQEELRTNFKEEVDTAVSKEVDHLLDTAVQNAIENEQLKHSEEMQRVRQGIQTVLERERRLMKEQVRRATGQVREWVVKQQQEQLLMQASKLQEEAEKFGNRGNTAGGSNAAGGGARNSAQQQQRRGPTSSAPRRGTAGARRAGSGGRAPERQQRQGSSSRPSRPISRGDYDDNSRGTGSYNRFDDDDGVGGN